MVDQANEHLAQMEARSRQEIEVWNPATGASIGRVPNFTAEMVRETVERARRAQVGWAATPVKERSRILKNFAKHLFSNQERIIEVLRQENGKARGGAHGEIVVAATVAEYYARYSARWLAPERRIPLVRGLFTAKVYRKPVGVVGNISPWNYPLLLVMIDSLPALAAGNAVVSKPSEITPYTAMEMARVLLEAGLPEDVFQVVTGFGDAGAALIEHVDFISFTGSTAVGRKVAVKAAERLIPYSLELGGNDAMIVLKDADLNKAAASAVAAGFENAGQVCISIERVIVEEPVYEAFLEKMKHWQAKLQLGTNDAAHCGSLTNERELLRTQAHIQDAVDKGARIIAGGKRAEDVGPLFHEATILADTTPDMAVMQDETFGPVVAVARAKDADDAVRIANSTHYGLSFSLWSKDTKRAEQVAVQLESGDVNINTALYVLGTLDLESGGVKDSGIGRRNGKQGLLKYTVGQSILIDNFPQNPDEPTVYTRRILGLLKLVRSVKKFLPFVGS
jgi:succinate-semialdehyde dehydrogenase / glutarate-semialdehyde dehydrogenase